MRFPVSTRLSLVSIFLIVKIDTHKKIPIKRNTHQLIKFRKIKLTIPILYKKILIINRIEIVKNEIIIIDKE
jgi:hypothetical protein